MKRRTKQKEEEKPICRHLRRGHCKHGLSGKEEVEKGQGGCKFRHPYVCNNFVNHGTDAEKGCTKGRDCRFFHQLHCNKERVEGYCESHIQKKCQYKHHYNRKEHEGYMNYTKGHQNSHQEDQHNYRRDHQNSHQEDQHNSRRDQHMGFQQQQQQQNMTTSPPQT